MTQGKWQEEAVQGECFREKSAKFWGTLRDELPPTNEARKAVAFGGAICHIVTNIFWSLLLLNKL